MLEREGQKGQVVACSRRDSCIHSVFRRIPAGGSDLESKNERKSRASEREREKEIYVAINTRPD